jgi:GNAT superfamily N-acetyltransferase
MKGRDVALPCAMAGGFSLHFFREAVLESRPCTASTLAMPPEVQSMQVSIEIVNPADDRIAQQISKILTEVSSDLAFSRGGHVPDEIVANIIHKKYTTMQAVQQTFAHTAVRFSVFDEKGEMIATALVSKSPGMMLARDSENLNFLCDGTDFPLGLHSTFNLAVRKQYRRHGVARKIFQAIENDHRHLFSGSGLISRAEPPEHGFYQRLGFRHQPAYDVFFEPGVVLPPGFATVREFNEKYDCACEKEPARRDRMGSQKLKYAIFVKPFEAPAAQ